MKKITLLKPHEHNGVVYPEGETVELPDEVVDYLNFAYMEARKAEVQAQNAKDAEDELQKMLAKHSRSKK